MHIYIYASAWDFKKSKIQQFTSNVTSRLRLSSLAVRHQMNHVQTPLSFRQTCRLVKNGFPSSLWFIGFTDYDSSRYVIPQRHGYYNPWTSHQPSSTIINHHQPSSTIINHHQPIGVCLQPLFIWSPGHLKHYPNDMNSSTILCFFSIANWPWRICRLFMMIHLSN